MSSALAANRHCPAGVSANMGNVIREELIAEVAAAEQDQDGQAAREQVCDAIAKELARLGTVLWLTGALLGTDRIDGTTPFGYGSDASVGLATAVQVGGELVAGTALLLRSDNRYAAASLVRQIVEVEYLTWAFGEDEAQARAWMRSSKEEREKMWQPRHLRRRSGGRFGKGCYAIHCERGGHPTPASSYLLPGHSHRQAAGSLWCDLAGHATNVWGYTMAAVKKQNQGMSIENSAEAVAVASAIDHWRATDPLWSLFSRVAMP
jgi:hypothetical protein